ncbi:M48 family peptidase [Candidatus Atribacteria bacterium MT.SAG.1]|nr:M48 family peptidase [Candidatus Atribacteria bacterium MT.SAG.1]
MKIEKIIRSKRKSIAMYINSDAELIVRAPFNTNEEIINKVVLKYKDRLQKTQKEVQLRNLKFNKKEFVNGERFLYLGNHYNLKLVDNREILLDFKDEFLLLKKYLSYAKNIFIIWYKRRAYEKISQRVEWYAQKNGFEYNKINITNARKRWGSCSHQGNLNFTWRLIMAPLPIIDSVVVHELVHLEVKNHSKVFWNKVGSLDPEYKKHKDWLKNNGHLLRL